MPNKIFQDYVKSGMFTLTLSKAMIDCLVYIEHCRLNTALSITHAAIYPNTMTYQALERRGLISNGVVGIHAEYGCHAWHITGAGDAVYNLLSEADMVDYDKYPLEAVKESA